MQILLIEDSSTIRKLVHRALANHWPDAVIREAEDGKEALFELKSKKVDLIITDLEMPQMTGYKFLELLTGNVILAKKPTVVYSSVIDDQLRNQYRAYSNIRFLDKPAQPAQIIEKAEEALSASTR